MPRFERASKFGGAFFMQLSYWPRAKSNCPAERARSPALQVSAALSALVNAGTRRINDKARPTDFDPTPPFYLKSPSAKIWRGRIWQRRARTLLYCACHDVPITLELARVRFIALHDPNPMIRKLKMAAWKLAFRHVASDTAVGTDRACGLFLIIGGYDT